MDPKQLARQQSYGAFVGRAMRKYQLEYPIPGRQTTPARWVIYRPPFPEYYQFKMRWLSKPTTMWEVYKGHHFLGRVWRMSAGDWSAWRAPIEPTDILVEDFLGRRVVEKCLGFRSTRAKATKLLLDWHADPTVEAPITDPGPFRERWPGNDYLREFVSAARALKDTDPFVVTMGQAFVLTLYRWHDDWYDGFDPDLIRQLTVDDRVIPLLLARMRGHYCAMRLAELNEEVIVSNTEKDQKGNDYDPTKDPGNTGAGTK